MFEGKNFVILSAERSELNAFQNMGNTLEMKEALTRRSMEFIEVNGVYKGTKEKSFAVKMNSSGDIHWIKAVARFFKQESVLAVDANKRAVLVFMGDNSGIELGTFHKVPKSVADSLEAYTETEDGFYAC